MSLLMFNLLMILTQTQSSSMRKSQTHRQKNTVCSTNIAAKNHITLAFSN